MIANQTELLNKILDVKNGKVVEGLRIGVPDIDEYVRYKQGNFNILIGHANVGKTSFIIFYFTLLAIKHKLRFLLWSSENTSQSIVRKIIEFKMNKPIQEASEAQIKKAIEWSDKHFKVIDVEDLYTYKDLLKEASAVKDAWDYDCLLIDPYNSLALDKQLIKSIGSTHDYHYQVASELRLFAKKKNVTIYLNAHGVTAALRSVQPMTHEYAGLPKPLAMADIEGGSKWSSRADDILCCHRYVSHPSEWMFTHILVLKVKENETGGRCTPYDNPILLRMAKNNVGFEYMGRNLIHDEPITHEIF